MPSELHDENRIAYASTILGFLAENAARDPFSVALLAPGRPPLTHARLWQQVDKTIAALKAIGLRRTDRIAFIVDNGPEAAVGFLSIAAFAACAPLNPSYKARELDAAFAALRPRAIIASGDLVDVVGEPAQALRR